MSGPRDNDSEPDFEISFGLGETDEFGTDSVEGDGIEFEEMPEPGSVVPDLGGDADAEFGDIGEGDADGFGETDFSLEDDEEGVDGDTADEDADDGEYLDAADAVETEEAAVRDGSRGNPISRLAIPAVAVAALLGVGWMGYSTVLPMFGFGGDHAPVAPPTAQFNPPPAGPVGFPVPTAGAPSTAPKLPPLPTPTGANVQRLPESIAPPVVPKLPAPSVAAGVPDLPDTAPKLPTAQVDDTPAQTPIVPKLPTPPVVTQLTPTATQPKPATMVEADPDRADDIRAAVRESMADVMNEVRQIGEQVGRFDTLFARLEAVEAKLASASAPDVDGRIGEVEAKVDTMAAMEKRFDELAAKLSAAESEITRLKKAGTRVSKSASQRPSASAGGAVPAQPRAAGLNPPAKPAIIENFFLQGVSRGVAVIKTPAGMTEVKEGTSIPGVGEVRSIRRADGEWVVVTSAGVIIQ